MSLVDVLERRPRRYLVDVREAEVRHEVGDEFSLVLGRLHLIPPETDCIALAQRVLDGAAAEAVRAAREHSSVDDGSAWARSIRVPIRR